MNKNTDIIADSSFYICFLDDIAQPFFLQSVFSQQFRFLTTKLLRDEISKSKNYSQLDRSKITIMDFPYNISEILRPFFGRNEILKGEHEVIAFSYVYYQINPDFEIILDEIGPRRFVERNFSYLAKLMIGTVGFLGKCCCDYAILPKPDAMKLVEAISHSKFRVSNNIVKSIKNQIQTCR